MYHDMPDLFFEQIKIWYETGKNDREIFFDKANVEYLKKFKDWNGFVEGNYLQDFIDHSGDAGEGERSSSAANYPKLRQLLVPINGNMPPMPYTGAKAKYLTEIERMDCLEQIHAFLFIAQSIIRRRAERLAEVGV